MFVEFFTLSVTVILIMTIKKFALILSMRKYAKTECYFYCFAILILRSRNILLHTIHNAFLILWNSVTLPTLNFSYFNSIFGLSLFE